jgi:hypothetical protein
VPKLLLVEEKIPLWTWTASFPSSEGPLEAALPQVPAMVLPLPLVLVPVPLLVAQRRWEEGHPMIVGSSQGH